MPVGTLLAYIGSLSDIPDGWRLCDGSDGTPDLRNRFLEGVTSSSNVNKFIEAGLPNIVGYVGRHSTVSAWGAFKTVTFNYTGENIGVGGGYTHNSTMLDASLYNPIYGRSNTVQPSSYTVYFIIKIA